MGFVTLGVPIDARRDIVIVTITESDTKPHFLTSGKKRSTYIRIDRRSLIADQNAIELMQADLEPVLDDTEEPPPQLLKVIEIINT